MVRGLSNGWSRALVVLSTDYPSVRCNGKEQAMFKRHGFVGPLESAVSTSWKRAAVCLRMTGWMDANLPERMCVAATDM